MLGWALTFLLLALVAGYMGFFGLAGLAATIDLGAGGCRQPSAQTSGRLPDPRHTDRSGGEGNALAGNRGRRLGRRRRHVSQAQQIQKIVSRNGRARQDVLLTRFWRKTYAGLGFNLPASGFGRRLYGLFRPCRIGRHHRQTFVDCFRHPLDRQRLFRRATRQASHLICSI